VAIRVALAWASVTVKRQMIMDKIAVFFMRNYTYDSQFVKDR
jgi:hypothetical protein